jgi:hypothetical protein
MTMTIHGCYDNGYNGYNGCNNILTIPAATSSYRELVIWQCDKTDVRVSRFDEKDCLTRTVKYFPVSHGCRFRRSLEPNKKASYSPMNHHLAAAAFCRIFKDTIL